eukprot:269611_1
MEKNEFAKLSRFLCVTVALFVGVYWIGSRLFKGEREYREVEIHDSSKTSKSGESSLGYKADSSVYRNSEKKHGLESEPGCIKNSANVLGAADDYAHTSPIRRRLNFDNLDEEA